MILGALLFIVEDSVKYDDLLSENLNEDSNDDLVSNLLVYFKMDCQNGYESGNDFEKSGTNLRNCENYLCVICFHRIVLQYVPVDHIICCRNIVQIIEQ